MEFLLQQWNFRYGMCNYGCHGEDTEVLFLGMGQYPDRAEIITDNLLKLTDLATNPYVNNLL